MRILVTVGSASFDQLISEVNNQLVPRDWSLCCQIADGKVIPDCEYFRFSDHQQYQRLQQQADVVITHGGAATVFELLGLGKKVVVVPNRFRLDKHQQDLARFIEQQHYGQLCWSLPSLADCVLKCIATDYNAYRSEPFFMAAEALSYFGVADGQQ